MKFIKKVCLIILSIMLFFSSTTLFSLVSLKNFLNTGVVESIIKLGFEELQKTDFSETNEGTLIFEITDDSGNYVGEYEIDVTDINFEEIEYAFEEYLNQIVEYAKDVDNNQSSINLDSNLIKEPLLYEIEKILQQIELENGTKIDTSEFDDELPQAIDELFVEINIYLNSEDFVKQLKTPIIYIDSFINGQWLIINIIVLIAITGLIFLISRHLISLIYVAVPVILSGLLIANIVFAFDFSLKLILVYLSAIAPLILGCGLIILYYFLKRKKQ